jgi:hypothetical protein
MPENNGHLCVREITAVVAAARAFDTHGAA